MILYRVYSGVITVLSVLRETNCGWREHNGGFINRSRMSEKYPRLKEWYYTTDLDEAKRWSKVLIQKLNDNLQVAKASFDDVEYWETNGSDEALLPKSRIISV